MIVTDRSALRPVRVGIEIAAALVARHGDRYRLENTDRLLSRESFAKIAAGEDPGLVAASWGQAEARWRQVRARYLLYR
jgi:hypothetical protein